MTRKAMFSAFLEVELYGAVDHEAQHKAGNKTGKENYPYDCRNHVFALLDLDGVMRRIRVVPDPPSIWLHERSCPLPLSPRLQESLFGHLRP